MEFIKEFFRFILKKFNLFLEGDDERIKKYPLKTINEISTEKTIDDEEVIINQPKKEYEADVDYSLDDPPSLEELRKGFR